MVDGGEIWERTGTVVTIGSPWVTMHCERWRDAAGAAIDYWRVEHDHSLIVLPLYAEQILLPAPMFRPGLGRPTLDLPGGRLPESKPPEEAALAILRRELGLDPALVNNLTPLNTEGWPVNSSFNNQLLFGMVATIDSQADLPPGTASRYPADRVGLRQLLADLSCLQCRAVVYEYLLRSDA
jgi:hypothetical protein